MKLRKGQEVVLMTDDRLQPEEAAQFHQGELLIATRALDLAAEWKKWRKTSKAYDPVTLRLKPGRSWEEASWEFGHHLQQSGKLRKPQSGGPALARLDQFAGIVDVPPLPE